MTSFGYRSNPRYAIKECSSCGTLYTRNCVCSIGIVKDKILVPKPPNNCVRCTRCGYLVDGPHCQGCALLRQELEENLVTYSPDFQNTSEPSNASTNVVNAPREPYVVKQDNGSFVDEIIFDLNRAPDSPNQFHCFHCKYVLRAGETCKRCTCAKCVSGLDKGFCYICGHHQNSVNDSPRISETSSQSPPNINHCCYECGDPLDGIFCKLCTYAHIGYNCPSKVLVISIPKPCNNQTIDEFPQALPCFHSTFHSEAESPFTLDSTPTYVNESPNVFNPPPQPSVYPCEFCRNDAYFGHYCTPQAPFIYPEPCYNQDFNFPQNFQNIPRQYPCCDDCGVTHEPYQCQPMNHVYYHGQNSCYDYNSIGFDQCQTPQYTVNHPNFNAHNDLFISQTMLNEQMTQLKSMCEIFCQSVQKKQEEKRIEEEQAVTAQSWKFPVCYDEDDDEESSNLLEDNIISELLSHSAVIPTEPIDSLSMGDEHLDTIPATESDEFIKSRVENLVPNPSESNDKNGCDVPVGFTTFSNALFDADYDSDSSDDQSLSIEDVREKIYSNPLFDEEIIPMEIDQHSFNAESDLLESMPNHDPSVIISSKIDSLFDEFAGELTLLKSFPPGIDETDCHPEKEICLTKRLLYDNSSPRPPKEIVSDNSNADIESLSPSPIPNEDGASHMEEIDLFLNPDDPMPPGIEDDDYDSGRDIPILEELLDNYSLSLPTNESYHFDIPSPYRPPAKPPDEKSPDLLSHLGFEAFQPSAECPMIINGNNIPLVDVPLFYFYPP
nr:hypothetical protein [Tanacetum cinerariifolium]